MKKLIIMAALAVAAFGFTQASAQKVIKDAAGNVFLDVQDMPAGSFSTATLNKVVLVEDAGNSVYKKLQIAKTDLQPNKTSFAVALGLADSYNTSGAVGQTQGTVKTGCSTYAAEGNQGAWRVPTLRELNLIFIMQSVLVKSGVAALVNDTYVSSIQHSTNSWCWMVTNAGTSNTGGNGKVYGKLIRCVREVN